MKLLRSSSSVAFINGHFDDVLLMCSRCAYCVARLRGNDIIVCIGSIALCVCVCECACVALRVVMHLSSRLRVVCTYCVCVLCGDVCVRDVCVCVCDGVAYVRPACVMCTGNTSTCIICACA
jgi:hypothetical protein